MKEMYIDIQPAEASWKECYGDDLTRVKIKEEGHFGIVYLSLDNARILFAAKKLHEALVAHYDMMTPSDKVDALARDALELAEGEPRPAFGVGASSDRPQAKRLFGEVALAMAYSSGYEYGLEIGRKEKGATS